MSTGPTSGLKIGIIAGLCYWFVDTFVMFAVMEREMGNPTTGFVPETFWLLVGSVIVYALFGAGAGAVLKAVGQGAVSAADGALAHVKAQPRFQALAARGPLGGVLRLESAAPILTVFLASVPFHVVVLAVSPEVDLLMGVGFLILHLGIALTFLVSVTWLWRRGAALALIAALLVGWTVFQNKGALWGGDPPKDPPRACEGEARRPNVVWIVMDTTRRDHLPFYGYPRDTAPNLARMASEGVVFEQAWATAPWTLESHAGMFSGMYGSRSKCTHETLHLSFEYSTLAEALREACYDTALFAGNPWLQDFTGLAQGYGRVFPSWRTYTLANLFVLGRLRNAVMATDQDKGAADSNKRAHAWLEELSPDRPFFMFFNYLEPHAPYYQIPTDAAMKFQGPGVDLGLVGEVSRDIMSEMMFSTGYKGDGAALEIAKATYDGAIWYTDQKIQEVVEMVRARGQLDNTLFIVSADHGELFGKGGIWGHELSLDEGLIHVPLLLWAPGLLPRGVRVKEPVQLSDVYPTLIEAIGRADLLPQEVQGVSLFPAIQGGADPRRPLFAEYFTPGHPVLKKTAERLGMDPGQLRIKALKVGNLKLVRGPGTISRLYDLSTDPEEEKDLAPSRPEEVQLLSTMLDAFVRDSEAGARASAGSGAPQMDKATEERLRALGYIK